MSEYKCAGKKRPAKDTAWKWFSKYIRLRDCLATTGTDDRCVCVTCGKIVYDGDGLEAGHAIPRRHNAVLFDPTIVYGQCHTCNYTNKGERQAFRMFLVNKHGEEWMQYKEDGAKKSVFITDDEFRLIGDHYRKAYKKLLGGV